MHTTRNYGLVKKITARVAYPAIIALGFYIYWLCYYHFHFPLSPSTFIAIGICAILITILESAMPYRTSWNPNFKDLATDSVYLGLVQIFIPKLVTFLIAIFILNFTNTHGWNVHTLWPHHYPVWVQFLMMLFIGDFFRYWIHRFIHNNDTLWRLHAVHHSSKKLYWINTARFHPLEKMAQFAVDMGPFIVMGVSEHVLAVFFVFYAVDGFFQHCNIDLKMGFLNYLVSGPQLHHWHHSSVKREGNKNFATHIILYDLLFGTWYLPKDREVDELGLTEKNYPQDFIKQQASPFTHRGY